MNVSYAMRNRLKLVHCMYIVTHIYVRTVHIICSMLSVHHCCVMTLSLRALTLLLFLSVLVVLYSLLLQIKYIHFNLNSANSTNFRSLEVVDRGSETQPPVTENLNLWASFKGWLPINHSSCSGFHCETCIVGSSTDTTLFPVVWTALTSTNSQFFLLFSSNFQPNITENICLFLNLSNWIICNSF